ncbi:MAG: tetratricopeptide repeat protein [Rhodospirillales bacterium]|nr:tetratricopeptide repeat protein [Rhodospirillales bacterium]
MDLGNADEGAVAELDFVTQEWLGFGKRFADFLAAADKEEKCPMLPLVAASLVLSMYSPEGHAAATGYLARAQKMTAGASLREFAWLGAIEFWVAGDTDRSLQQFRRIVADWPRDLLAGKLAQLLAFNRGDAETLLDVGERLVAANADNRFVWGMYAFGLEECNRLDEAEATARKGLAIDRRDPWAHHAIAHCLEARGRMLEGVAFLNSVSDTWNDCNSFMYTHNWWHLALFLIDLDRTDEALALYDSRVWGVWKEFCEDQANAVSLLARLQLRGVDVGARWSDLAFYLRPRLHEHFSAFHDVHYLYGLACAGERSAVTEMLASLEDRAERARPFEREVWADCVVPLAHGLAAHAAGDMPAAARQIGRAMPHLRRLGGSIAQRALFGAIHLDALVHAGWNDAALAILQADERERPGVAATKRALAMLYRRVGRTEQALGAEYQAEQLARQYRAAAAKTGEAA